MAVSVRPALRPLDKGLAIGFANAVILGFVLISSQNGFGKVDESKPLILPSLDSYRLWAWATLALCFSPPVLALLWGVIIRLVGGEVDPQGSTLVLHKETPAAKVYLWSITLLSYGAASALVLATGGLVKSPYAIFPVTLVLLAPIIMTGEATPWINLIGGLLFTSLLYYVSRIDPISHWEHPLPDNVSAATWVYAVETGIVILASLIFNLVKELVGHRRLASTALLIPPTPPPPGP